MCRIRLFASLLALTAYVMAGNLAQAVVIYSENFDAGANGQSILDPPFSYAANFGELGPPAYPINDATPFGPSLAVNAAANTSGLSMATIDVAGPSGAADTVYTLTAKLYAHITGAANGSPAATSDSWIGLAKPTANGGLSFNNSGAYLGYSASNTNPGRWRFDARGVRSSSATDVFLFDVGLLRETIVDATIRFDINTNTVTGTLTDGTTTLTHSFVGGNDFSNITRFVIQQRYNGIDVDNVLIQETIVPEPATITLLGLGSLVSVLIRASRRKV